MIKIFSSALFALVLTAGFASAATPATGGSGNTNGVVGGSGALFDNSK